MLRGLQGCLLSMAVQGTRRGVCLMAALDEALSVQFPTPRHFRQHHNGSAKLTRRGLVWAWRGGAEEGAGLAVRSPVPGGVRDAFLPRCRTGVGLVSCLPTLLCCAQNPVPSRCLGQDHALQIIFLKLSAPYRRRGRGGIPHLPSTISYGAWAPQESRLSLPFLQQSCFCRHWPHFSSLPPERNSGILQLDLRLEVMRLRLLFALLGYQISSSHHAEPFEMLPDFSTWFQRPDWTGLWATWSSGRCPYPQQAGWN